jgi:hypothetical protein
VNSCLGPHHRRHGGRGVVRCLPGSDGTGLVLAGDFAMITIMRLAAIPISLASRHRDEVIFGINVLFGLIFIAVLAMDFAALEFAVTGGQMSGIELAGP